MRLRRSAARGMAVAAGAALLVLPGPAPAAADTSTAWARAVAITGPGGRAATRVSAVSNNGEQQTRASGAVPPLALLGPGSLITAGTLVQRAAAYPDGTSTACAGLIGAGGTLSAGADGSCTASGGDGVRIDLGGSATIEADAVVASCRAAAGTAPVATATLANASVRLLGLPLLGLPSTPAPNTGLDIAGVATLLLGARDTPAGAGSVRGTALRIDLPGSAVTVELGIAGCGRNAVVRPVPDVPAGTLPAIGAALGAAVWLGRHRLRAFAAAR